MKLFQLLLLLGVHCALFSQKITKNKVIYNELIYCVKYDSTEIERSILNEIVDSTLITTKTFMIKKVHILIYTDDSSRSDDTYLKLKKDQLQKALLDAGIRKNRVKFVLAPNSDKFWSNKNCHQINIWVGYYKKDLRN